jgi:hypothetical protein
MNAAACGHSHIISTSETYPWMYEVDWALAHDAIGDRDVAVPRVLGPRWIHARILPQAEPRGKRRATGVEKGRRGHRGHVSEVTYFTTRYSRQRSGTPFSSCSP